MLPVQGALSVSRLQSLGLNFLSLRLKIQSLGLKILSLGLKFLSLGLKFLNLGPWFEPMTYTVRAAGATARSAEMPHSKAGTCAPNELFFLLLHEKATPHYTHDPR